MPIEVKVKGRRSAMADLLGEVKAESKKIEKKTKRKLIQGLKDETPVDTGEARDGWHETPTGIANNVEHIIPLNEGTSKQAPSRFIERTVLRHPGINPSGIIVRHK